MSTHEATLTFIDPEEILADSNSRFGLKKIRIERLASEIVNDGGVNTPVEVEPLNPPVDGKSYRLTVGFYRHAAVSFLNENSAAGLLLPAVVHANGDETSRLRRQLSENMERENQSPMDKAVAIKKLTDTGMSKMDIRKIFSTPGGRKGLTMQPASNSFLNMTMSFLELPKPIQEKIHDGRIGVAAAYELTKVPADKRQEVLDKAEAARLSQIDREEKEEEKFLKAEKASAEISQKHEEVTKEHDEIKVTAESAAKTAEEKLNAAAEAYKASKAKGLAADAKKEAEAKFKSAEAEARTAEQVAEKTRKELEKTEKKAQAIAAKAQEQAAKLAAARAAKAPGKQVPGKKMPSPAPVSGKDVKKAASQTPGAQEVSQYVALTATEMRKVIADFQLPGSYPKVQEIGKIIHECFMGKTTPPQCYTALAKVTGEFTPPKAGAAKK